MIYARPAVKSLESADFFEYAIVFGAGLNPDGRPTTVLRERIETAAALYHCGKATKILLSGDNRWVYYNEPAAMKLYALECGIPEENILIDPDGKRSYDTLLRAKTLFGIDRALLATQAFHLSRVIFLARKLGMVAEGVPAAHQRHGFGDRMIWRLREIPATARAWWDTRNLRE